MKFICSILGIIGILCMAGCQIQQGETMVLLDEKVSEINISISQGFGGINEDILLSINPASVKSFTKAITTAQKNNGEVDISEPEFDVMVVYESNKGKLPTHAMHLWLGEENEKSTLMYLEDNIVYYTSVKSTKVLRDLILKNE